MELIESIQMSIRTSKKLLQQYKDMGVGSCDETRLIESDIINAEAAIDVGDVEVMISWQEILEAHQ